MPYNPMDLDVFRNLGHLRDGTGVHSTQMYGLYRGSVEYNRDPQQRGRIMVRILEDGPEMKIANAEEPRVATFDLGWCEPCFNLAGGKYYGTFSVPPVGSRVFVMFIRGDRQCPVYFGGWVANPDKQRRYGATKTTLNPPKNKDGTEKYPTKPPPYWNYWNEDQGNESPMEASEMLDNQPDVHIMFKTLKGASLIVKERDHVEEVVITDRAGAELRFESYAGSAPAPATVGPPRRGRRSATQHTPIGVAELEFRHRMQLVDVERQGLETEVSNAGDRSVILHQNQSIPKSADTAAAGAALELNMGELKARLKYATGDEETSPELSYDVMGKSITLQGLETLKLKTKTNLEIKAERINLSGEVTIDGDIRTIGGHKIIFADNETTDYGSQITNMWYHYSRPVESSFTIPVAIQSYAIE